MRCILLTALALSAPAAAQNPALTLAVENVVHDGGYNKAVVRVKNGGATALRVVFVDCAFMVGGKALATSSAVIENLAAGETGYATVMERMQDAAEARCRVSKSAR